MFAWMSQGTELKRFFRQPITRGAVAVMLLIPLLYGAMYVWAFWDPTSRMDDLPVALVNEDVPAVISGDPLSAGTSVVNTLMTEKPLKWQLTDSADAATGVKDGTYYFSVTIPSTFSSDIASLQGKQPTAAMIQVQYNDANSFLASTLGRTAMLQIRDAVSQNISEQATKTLLVGLNDARTGLLTASDGAFKIDDGLATATDGAKQLSVGTEQLAAGAAELNSGAGRLAAGTSAAATQVKPLADGVAQLSTGAEQLSAGLDQLKAQTPALVAGAQAAAVGASQVADGASQLDASQRQYVDGVRTASAGAQSLASGLDRLNSTVAQVGPGVTRLSTGADQLTALVTGLSQAADADTGAPALAAGLHQLDTQFATLAGGAGEYATGATDFAAGASTFSGGAGDYSTGATDFAQGADQFVQAAREGTSQLATGAGHLTTATGANSQLFQGASAVAAGTASLPGQLKTLNAAIGEAQALLAAGRTDQAAQVLSAVSAQTGTTAQAQAQQLATGAAAVRDGIYNPADNGATVNGAASGLAAGSTQLAGAVSSTGALAQGASQLAAGAQELGAGATQLANSAPTLAQGSTKLADGAATLGAAKPQIDQLAAGAGQLSAGVTEMSRKASTGIPALQDGIAQLDRGVNDPDPQKGLVAAVGAADQGARQLAAGFTAGDPQKGLVAGAEALQAGTAQVADGATQLSGGTTTLASGAATLGAGVTQLADGGRQVAAGTGQLDAKVPALVSGVQQLDAGAQQIATATAQLRAGSATLAARTPHLADGLSTLRDGSHTLATQLGAGAQRIPNDQATTRDQRATAMSDPVHLSQSHLHEAASWGEGFAPFFIGLGLWVGALITWLLLRPMQSRALMTSVSGFRMAWASLNPALTLAVGQVVIMLTVMHFAIGLDPSHVVATIAFALLVAASFYALQQLFQVAFGPAVGKVVIITLLMVQLASAGGTYPIQTEPGFFKAISPWLPMTYVVNGLRDAITGDLGSRFWLAALILAAVFAVSLALTSWISSHKRTWTLSRLHPALEI